MNKHFFRLRASPMLRALLSLGISALPSMRAARIPIARPVTPTAASRHRSSHVALLGVESLRWPWCTAISKACARKSNSSERTLLTSNREDRRS